MWQLPYQPAARPQVSPVVKVLMSLFIIGVVAVSEQPIWNWVVKGIGVMMAIAYLMNIWRTKMRVLPEAILYMCFIGWSLAALPVVRSPTVYWIKFQTIVMVCILLTVVSGLTTSRRTLTLMVTSFLIGAFILASMAFLSGGFVRESGTYGSYADATETQSHTRLSWGMNPNGFGRMMVMGCLSIGYLWLVLPKRRRLLRMFILVPMMLIMIAACIHSGSRFSILMMGAAALGFFFWGYRQEVKRNPAMILYVLVALAVLMAFAILVGKNSIGFDRMGRTVKGLSDSSADGAGLGRIHIVLNSLEVFLDNIILGVGLEQYRFYDRSGHVAHNEYGEVGANTGLIGFCLYFSIWVMMIIRSGRMLKRSPDPIDQRIGGIYRSFVFVLLFSGLGAPMYMTKWVWSLMAAFIGYAATVEDDIKLWHGQQHWWTAQQQQMLAAQAAWRQSQEAQGAEVADSSSAGAS